MIGRMSHFSRRFLLASVLLLGAGCAAVDDREEQSEFEKLRKHPLSPQGDRPLPLFDVERGGGEALAPAAPPPARRG
jgi:hypothetical protein